MSHRELFSDVVNVKSQGGALNRRGRKNNIREEIKARPVLLRGEPGQGVVDQLSKT